MGHTHEEDVRSVRSASSRPEMTSHDSTAHRHPLLELQRAAGNRAVVALMRYARRNANGTAVMTPILVQRSVPPTNVTWTNITKTDTIPPPPALGPVPTSFTFAHTMDADPLSTDPNGYKGSGPNGKAPWWPWFQKRHGMGGLYWVQAHLLNDNLYGPGEPKNLVPFSNTSNTNMETQGERAVKDAVLKAGKVVHYKVTAVWDKEPADRRKAWGLIAEQGSLLWGEQFAPTRIDWQAAEKEEQPQGSGHWVDKTPLTQPSPGWYNTFPDPGHVPAQGLPVVPSSLLAVNVVDGMTASGDSEVVIDGSGFGGGSILLEWARHTKPTFTETVSPAVAAGKFTFRRTVKQPGELAQLRVTDIATGNWVVKSHTGSPWS